MGLNAYVYMEYWQIHQLDQYKDPASYFKIIQNNSLQFILICCLAWFCTYKFHICVPNSANGLWNDLCFNFDSLRLYYYDIT